MKRIVKGPSWVAVTTSREVDGSGLKSNPGILLKPRARSLYTKYRLKLLGCGRGMLGYCSCVLIFLLL